MNDAKSAYYKIMNDIDCSDTVNWNAGAGFLPVGNSTSGQNFTGSLDGDGRTISGLTINRPGTDYIGLFGFMSGSGSVTNLTFSGVSITGRQYTATLAGRSNSTITNVHVTSGVVTGTSDVAGVLGEYITRTASSISSAANVSGTNYVGGLIGRMYFASKLEYSFATGNVSTSGASDLGGLVGFIWGDDSIVRYSYSRGNVTGCGGNQGCSVSNGGIVGQNRGLVEYVYATGSVTGGNTRGGISGYNLGGITRYSYWDTQTTGQAGAVGLISNGGSSSNNTGRTTAQMTSDYSVNLPNFNWASIWAGDGYYNNGYPYLQIQSFGSVSRPTIQASNVISTPGEITSNISWTNGNGTFRIVFMRAGDTGAPAPVDATTYAASSAFGSGTQVGSSGWYAVYKGTGTSVTVTALAPNTTYRMFVVEFNGSAGSELYFTDTATGNPANFTTVAIERPTNPASNISVGNISAKSGTVSWTSGNGVSRVVFMKEGDSGDAAPVDSTIYTSSSAFGSGTQIGSTGWYAVYKGTGSSVTVSNLDSTKNYRVHVVEFNGTAGYESYLTTGASAVITKAAYAGTVIYANSATGNDSTGNGSSGNPYKTVRKAYTEAVDGDIIDLTGTFTWTDAAESTSTTSGFVLSKHNITIRGQKAGDTILQASVTDDSANRRIFTISSNMTIAIEKITMRYGKMSSSSSTACVFVDSGVNLTLRQVDIHNCRNTSTSTVGSGAIYVTNAIVTIENSSIRNNTAAKNAGAIYITGASAEVVITNSTLSDNTADAVSTTSYGGAIYALGSAKVWLTNTTIKGNTAYHGALAISGASSFIFLKNTIISGNTATDATNINLHRISSGTFTSGGYNIIGKHNASIFTTTTGDWADADGDGTYALHGTANTGELSLGNTIILDDTTGTSFYPLLNDSIGINHGSSEAHIGGGRTVNIPASDQRGVSRVGSTDIGAYEFTPPDLTPPVVLLTSPANNATGVALGANLIITFIEAVNVETGNISIYKASDDTLIEAIDVTSGQVTGSGTAIITINLTDPLASGTEYYVLIDATAFDDLAGNSFVGITDKTTWSFTSLDIVPPVISNPLPTGEQSAGIGSVTLSVLTNEIATCKYSTISGTAFAGMTVFSSTGATSHSTNVPTSDGVSYSYYVLCQDPALNESSEATINFSVAEVLTQPVSSSRSTGTTIQARVQHLITTGNEEAANSLMQQYPNLFAQASPIPVVPIQTAPTPTSNTPNTNSVNVSSTRQLQRFLNTNGFPVALSGPGSLNNETDVFGDLTRKALARFQAANGISPAAGYFGPVTRAFIANMNTIAPATIPAVIPVNTPVITQTVRDLTFGMRGSDVTALQQLLITQGYSIPAGATGLFASQTSTALVKYQSENGIVPAAGYFGSITRSEMKSRGLRGLWW